MSSKYVTWFYKATMLNGASVMDAALLIIAANLPCPQPQTREHLKAMDFVKQKNIIILQTKIDLVTPKEAALHVEQIRDFVRGSVADNALIVPVAAEKYCNIDVIAQLLCSQIPVPKRDFSASPLLNIVRSFDINKPGAELDKLKGGVVGGTLQRGVLRVGDELELRPGLVTKEMGIIRCQPVRTRVQSCFSESTSLAAAVPGGLVAVGTKLDPVLSQKDNLVGQILGVPGTMPDIYIEIEVAVFLPSSLAVEPSSSEKPATGASAAAKLSLKPTGSSRSTSKLAPPVTTGSSTKSPVSSAAAAFTPAAHQASQLVLGEVLSVNIGANKTVAKVMAVQSDLARLKLSFPACATIGDKLTLSRRVMSPASSDERSVHWRLIGWAKIMHGVPPVLVE